MVLKDEYSSLYRIIVALLNSNVLNWYYANNFSNNSKLTVNISKTYLEMLPIPNIISKYKDRLDKLVDEVMQKKNIDSQTDTTAEEQEIDRLVYHLYGLTYEEVKIIDPQTPIIEEED